MDYETDLTESASVQYNDWMGTVAADAVDMHRMEEFIGVDPEYRVLVVDMAIYGGSQWLTALGVPKNVTYADLEALVGRGEPIVLTVVGRIEWNPPGHSDSNPPPPPQKPVDGVTMLLGFGFKRLHIRLVYRGIPEGAALVTDEAV